MAFTASIQIKGWQVRKRPIGMRPRIAAVPSVANAPNERWSTDLCRVWAGRDGWTTLALVIDCHTRELLGWHLSRSGKATTAASALEHALISRFGTLGKVTREFLLRSCIDPVKICSCYKGEGSDECDDGRQHQAVDGEA